MFGIRNKGFTIIEVIVSLLIFSTIMFGVFQFTRISMKQASTSTNLGEWSALIASVNNILSNDELCAGIFKDYDENTIRFFPIKGESTPIKALRLVDENILFEGQKLEHYIISSISLENLRTLKQVGDENRYTVIFRVIAQASKESGKNVFGVQSLEHKLLLNIASNKNTNEFLGCLNTLEPKYKNKKTFDRSGKWKVPDGVYKVLVEAWGGGGGGASGNGKPAVNDIDDNFDPASNSYIFDEDDAISSAGGGGGGGEYVRGFVEVSPGQEIDIIIGEGGKEGRSKCKWPYPDVDRDYEAFDKLSFEKKSELINPFKYSWEENCFNKKYYNQKNKTTYNNRITHCHVLCGQIFAYRKPAQRPYSYPYDISKLKGKIDASVIEDNKEIIESEIEDIHLPEKDVTESIIKERMEKIRASTSIVAKGKNDFIFRDIFKRKAKTSLIGTTKNEEATDGEDTFFGNTIRARGGMHGYSGDVYSPNVPDRIGKPGCGGGQERVGDLCQKIQNDHRPAGQISLPGQPGEQGSYIEGDEYDAPTSLGGVSPRGGGAGAIPGGGGDGGRVYKGSKPFHKGQKGGHGRVVVWW